jgi:hypothetical protein
MQILKIFFNIFSNNFFIKKTTTTVIWYIPLDSDCGFVFLLSCDLR